MTSNEIKKLTGEHLAATYKRYDVALKSGKGATAFDFEGKKYIDFTSGIGVNAIGYSNPKWADAVYEQAKTLSHTSNLCYTEPAALLANELTKAAGMKKVFWGNSGAEANEGAIKAARKYSVDKYRDKKRTNIITLKKSFHGRTVTTLAATGQEVFHNHFFPFTEGFLYAEPGDIEGLKTLINGTVCAVMLEGVQGEGGINPLPFDYVAQAKELCEQNDVLLVFDEIQTGVGRTGKLFSYMHYGITPDIATVAKGLGGGLPIGGVLFNEKTAQVFDFGSHGSTFGANPIAAAGARVVLHEILAPGFLDGVVKKGEKLKTGVLEVGKEVVEGAKGLGMMLGFTLKPGYINADIIALCVENGLLLLSSGQNMLRLLPPLTISDEEIDEGLSILKKVFDEVK